MATGLGKGTQFASLVGHTRPDKRSMVIVHTQDLVEQGAERISDWNPELGVEIEMADRKASKNAPVVVASIQTLSASDYSRLNAFDPAALDWLVVDEAHHCPAETYKNTVSYFLDSPNSQAAICGFTATPNRPDSLAMGTVFDEIVFQYGIQDGIRDGWLVDIKGIRVKTQTDISHIKSENGEFQKKELEEAVNTPERNHLVARAWIENCEQRCTVVFCVDIQHAKDMALAFQMNSIPCEAVWGTDPKKAEKMAAYKRGDLQVLINVKKLIEGFDHWPISCVVLAAPTRSQTSTIQRIGRGTRLQPDLGNLLQARLEGRIKYGDKTDLLVMDVCDVTSRHSLVTLPTLFGLGPGVDLKGTSVLEAMDAVAKAQAAHPDLDFSRIGDIRKLNTYIEKAKLFEVSFCEEIVEVSELQWHKRGPNTYCLLLPGREQITITGNLLNKFSVDGCVSKNRVNQDGFDGLPDALAFAEKKLVEFGKELLVLLRRESRWHKEPLTDGQLKLLKQFRVPASVYGGWTKGTAAKFITKRLGEKRKK